MPLPPDRVDYLPIIDRPIIKWPNNARVAFWVAPNVEHYESDISQIKLTSLEIASLWDTADYNLAFQ
jgi:hypothetical protein